MRRGKDITFMKCVEEKLSYYLEPRIDIYKTQRVQPNMNIVAWSALKKLLVIYYYHLYIYNTPIYIYMCMYNISTWRWNILLQYNIQCSTVIQKTHLVSNNGYIVKWKKSVEKTKPLKAEFKTDKMKKCEKNKFLFFEWEKK